MNQFITGMEPETVPIRRTQVYLATHEEGGFRLPFMNRSFISFTYGGYSIEDLGLIVITENNRMLKKLYGAFNDNTTTSDVLDGTTYWSTHFVNNEFTFNLATDEMTEDLLNEFKRIFTPGPPKELILAENPNRAIMARVKQPPEYLMLPFEKRITKKIADVEYEISTTIYRGAIELLLVADDPFWYAKYNILPSYAYNLRNEWVKATDSPDMLKIIAEDGVPIREMFVEPNLIISGNGRLNVGEQAIAGGVNNKGEHVTGSKVGVRLRTIIVTLNSGSQSTDMYLFYAGTAPAPTIINFSLKPEIDTNFPYYIKYPGNSIYEKASTGGPVYIPYNELKVGDKVFKFSTPSLYTGYNLALQIVQSLTDNISLVDLKLLLSDGVKEYYSRAWALGVLNWIKVKNPDNCINEALMITNIGSFLTNFHILMSQLLGVYMILPREENIQETFVTIEPQLALFSFNSKTGQAKGTFIIRLFKDNVNFSNCEDISEAYEVKEVVENVGDMVKSEYLYLTDRNYIDDNGMIPLDNCSKITTNYPQEVGGLINFDIQYKHTYL